MKASDHATLVELRGAHQGEQLFILGSGPSLHDLGQGEWAALRRERTFGLNYLFQWDRLPFIPDYWAIYENDIILTVAEAMEADGRLGHIPKFFASETDYNDGVFYNAPGWTWIYRHPKAQLVNGAFNGLEETFEWTGFAGSPALIAVQLGCWMGFESIYLVGCDNSQVGHCYNLEDERVPVDLSLIHI